MEGTVSGARKRSPVQTSVFLQVFIYFGGIFDAVWWLCELVLFVWKGIRLPYPTANFTLEFIFLWLYLIIGPPRLHLSSRGNKSESKSMVLFGLILSLPLVALHIYYMLFQTFVLRLELLLNAASLFFIGMQVIFMLYCLFNFRSRR
uniref:Transmembrane protein 216 n=1 Tax=Tetraselmis sp. GSL018 TaxID=582737 RepID=A0A061S6C2_9CHLO